MNNQFEIDGMRGTVEYSDSDRCWHGRIVGIDDLVTYESPTRENLYVAFCEAVQDYRDIKDARAAREKSSRPFAEVVRDLDLEDSP